MHFEDYREASKLIREKCGQMLDDDLLEIQRATVGSSKELLNDSLSDNFLVKLQLYRLEHRLFQMYIEIARRNLEGEAK